LHPARLLFSRLCDNYKSLRRFKVKKIIIVFLLIILIVWFGTTEMSAEKYLGQKLPGLTPEIFAPGLVSTGMREFASAFSPDGKEFYFINGSGPVPAVVFMKEKNNRWTKPRVAAFSGVYRDFDPMFSYDGKKLFYCSTRPVEKNGKAKKDADLWVVERSAKGWSEPRRLGPGVNSDKPEYYPCVTRNGNLYFTSGRAGGLGSSDIYRCKPVNGGYSEPENLGSAINSKTFEGDVFAAPDESYMIVTCYGRPDSLGSGDLYISFRQKDGSWSKLKNMGSPVNSKANEHCPMVSMDGKVFFFTSYRSTIEVAAPLKYDDILKIQPLSGNGRGDIFWMDAKIIRRYARGLQ
jgi:hypothetical protein